MLVKERERMNSLVEWIVRRVALSQLSEADRLYRSAKQMTERADRMRREAELTLSTVTLVRKYRE